MIIDHIQQWLIKVGSAQKVESERLVDYEFDGTDLRDHQRFEEANNNIIQLIQLNIKSKE